MGKRTVADFKLIASRVMHKCKACDAEYPMEALIFRPFGKRHGDYEMVCWLCYEMELSVRGIN